MLSCSFTDLNSNFLPFVILDCEQITIANIETKIEQVRKCPQRIICLARRLFLSLDFEFVYHSETNTKNAQISNVTYPYILLSTIFLKSLILHYSLNVSEQVSHPYKKPGKIVLLYILIFIFVDSNMEDVGFCTE
jgi:hypothetical protein